MHSSQGSILERHHLSQTICILNTDRCNFLECLGSENYRKCLDLIKNNILATDLANHLKMLEAQQAMAETGYNNKNPEHENLLQCLLMTCADLSDQTKHWSVVKKVAKYITDEFFYQGDLEKEMGTVYDQ